MFFSSKSPLEQAQKANKMQEQQQKHHYNGIHIYKRSTYTTPKRGISPPSSTPRREQIGKDGQNKADNSKFLLHTIPKDKNSLAHIIIKKSKKDEKAKDNINILYNFVEICVIDSHAQNSQ